MVIEYDWSLRHTFAITELIIEEVCDSLGYANWYWNKEGHLVIVTRQPIIGSKAQHSILGSYHYIFKNRQEYDKAVQLHVTFKD